MSAVTVTTPDGLALDPQHLSQLLGPLRALSTLSSDAMAGKRKLKPINVAGETRWFWKCLTKAVGERRREFLPILDGLRVEAGKRGKAGMSPETVLDLVTKAESLIKEMAGADNGVQAAAAALAVVENRMTAAAAAADGRIDELGRAARDEYQAVMAAARRTLEHQRQLGEYLLEAKRLVKARDGWGGWLKWLGDNVGCSERTARNAVTIASHWDRVHLKIGNVAELSIREFFGHLSAILDKKPPTDAANGGLFEKRELQKARKGQQFPDWYCCPRCDHAWFGNPKPKEVWQGGAGDVNGELEELFKG